MKPSLLNRQETETAVRERREARTCLVTSTATLIAALVWAVMGAKGGNFWVAYAIIMVTAIGSLIALVWAGKRGM
jgi:hypothetical protein